LGPEGHEVLLRPHGDVVVVPLARGTGFFTLPTLGLRPRVLPVGHGLPRGLGLANVPPGRLTLLLGSHVLPPLPQRNPPAGPTPVSFPFHPKSRGIKGKEVQTTCRIPGAVVGRTRSRFRRQAVRPEVKLYRRAAAKAAACPSRGNILPP